MPEMPEEVEKLKTSAANIRLLPSERVKAIEVLGDICTREALLALLDVAGESALLPSERSFALSKANEIIKSGRT